MRDKDEEILNKLNKIDFNTSRTKTEVELIDSKLGNLDNKTNAEDDWWFNPMLTIILFISILITVMLVLAICLNI